MTHVNVNTYYHILIFVVFFVQLSKLLCIPVTLVIQYFAYHSSVTNSVKMTLIPITFGVGYATVYDLELSFTGIGM